MKKIIPVLLVISLVLSASCFSFASSKDALDDLFVSKSKSSTSSNQYDFFPEFDADITEYAVFLPDGEDDAYICMEPDDSDYTVYCEGDKITKDDDYFAQINNIKDGDDIEVVVKDEDGDKLKTYKITFYCGDDDDDDEANLEDLYVKNKTDSSTYTKVALDNDFKAATSDYKVDISSKSYKSIQIYAEPEDSGATVLINGYVVGSSGYRAFDLEEGKNKFEIKVVAENCDDVETYELTVNFDINDHSSTLSYLYARDSGSNSISLSPTFSSTNRNYIATVPNSVNSISFNLTAMDKEATVYLNNTVQTSGSWTTSYTLNEGSNTFPIKGYQSDAESTTTTYNVSIYRQAKSTETLISAQKLTVDGVSKSLNAYNINSNNFVKLRDIASLISGTTKQFSVAFNESSNAIVLLSKSYYTSNGQENVALSKPKEIFASSQSVYLDGTAVNIMTYNIDGNNYVLLRDLAMILNFGLNYDTASETIKIVTASSYSN